MSRMGGRYRKYIISYTFLRFKHPIFTSGDGGSTVVKVLYLLTYLLTYLLNPWSRVLLEKLASLQLVKKFPAFYGTRRFLTALTSARHLSLS